MSDNSTTPAAKESKWYNSILASAKRVFGLDAESTEQEVQQKMSEAEDYASLKATAAAEVAAENTAKLTALEAKVTTQTAEIKKLEDELNAEKTAVTTAQEEIVKLKAIVPEPPTDVAADAQDAPAPKKKASGWAAGINARAAKYAKKKTA